MSVNKQTKNRTIAKVDHYIYTIIFGVQLHPVYFRFQFDNERCESNEVKCSSANIDSYICYMCTQLKAQ